MIVLFTIVILILIEELMEHWYKKKKNSDVYRFHHMPKQLDICNVGSGPGLYAITYEKCSRIGFNMSTSPQSFLYGYKILKQYKYNIKKYAIIIIIMCPLSFGNNLDYNKKNYDDVYYGLLPAKEINHFSVGRALILAHPLMMKVVQKLIRITLKNRKVHNEQAKDAEPQTVSGWKRQFELSDLQNAEQAKAHQAAFLEKINILAEEIQFCYQHSWKPILVIPPVPEYIRKYISDDFINAFVYMNIKELQKQFPDLRLLDYYKDSRFTEKMFMFQSSVFMNEDGRKYYSKILFDDIRTIMGSKIHNDDRT